MNGVRKFVERKTGVVWGRYTPAAGAQDRPLVFVDKGSRHRGVFPSARVGWLGVYVGHLPSTGPRHQLSDPTPAPRGKW